MHCSEAPFLKYNLSKKVYVLGLIQLVRDQKGTLEDTLYRKEREAYLIRKFNSFNKGMNKKPQMFVSFVYILYFMFNQLYFIKLLTRKVQRKPMCSNTISMLCVVVRCVRVVHNLVITSQQARATLAAVLPSQLNNSTKASVLEAKVISYIFPVR